LINVDVPGIIPTSTSFDEERLGVMREARERRWMKWLQRVEFCDGCGRVCTAGCRAAAARTAVVDRALTMGLPR
jgi:hypothetical protein